MIITQWLWRLVLIIVTLPLVVLQLSLQCSLQTRKFAHSCSRGIPVVVNSKTFTATWRQCSKIHPTTTNVPVKMIGTFKNQWGPTKSGVFVEKVDGAILELTKVEEEFWGGVNLWSSGEKKRYPHNLKVVYILINQPQRSKISSHMRKPIEQCQ